MTKLLKLIREVLLKRVIYQIFEEFLYRKKMNQIFSFYGGRLLNHDNSCCELRLNHIMYLLIIHLDL